MIPGNADPIAASSEDVLAFWFGAAPRSKAELDACMQRWFGGGTAQDLAIASGFGTAIEAAARGELDDWAYSPRGRLALIVLLDQFSRSVYRRTRRAFAQDAAALELTLGGIDAGLDRDLAPLERMFFYMPLQHAESLEVQERSVVEFGQLAAKAEAGFVKDALAGSARYAKQHRDIIARFGRFPHRNAVLGRRNTPAEASYLAQDAPKFGQ